MNLEIETEPTQFPEKEYIKGIFVADIYDCVSGRCITSWRTRRTGTITCSAYSASFSSMRARTRSLTGTGHSSDTERRSTVQFSMWFNISVDYTVLWHGREGGALIYEYMSTLQSDGERHRYCNSVLLYMNNTKCRKLQFCRYFEALHELVNIRDRKYTDGQKESYSLLCI